jgi:hypothetical protein
MDSRDATLPSSALRLNSSKVTFSAAPSAHWVDTRAKQGDECIRLQKPLWQRLQDSYSVYFVILSGSGAKSCRMQGCSIHVSEQQHAFS